MVRICFLTVFCACLLVWPGLYQPTYAANARSRTERQATTPQRVFVPAATAPAGSSALVLSGLDYTAIAPVGERLRVIEDEPYIYVTGDRSSLKPHTVEAASALRVVSARQDGGTYEARLTIRIAYNPTQQDQLLASFDQAAASVYRASAITREERDAAAYSLHEVRSPLGLTHPLDKTSGQREYLAYSASVLPPSTAIDDTSLPTTYHQVSGQLKYIRLLREGLALVTIEFSAQDYPHSLTLSENLARVIANRLDPKMSYGERLGYLAYQPEFEPAIPFYEGEGIDPRTADLAEQPGEGCGLQALPANGAVCPACTDELPHTPATPHAATVLDVMGPSIYQPGGSRALDAGAPFPPRAECYSRFVRRYMLARQRSAHAALLNPQLCQATPVERACCSPIAQAAAMIPAFPQLEESPDAATPSELASPSRSHPLPPELLARLKLVTELVHARQDAPGLTLTELDSLAGGVTATTRDSASGKL